MKMKPMLLLATLLLSALPTFSQAEGAPAMPMVVCHVDKAPPDAGARLCLPRAWRQCSLLTCRTRGASLLSPCDEPTPSYTEISGFLMDRGTS